MNRTTLVLTALALAVAGAEAVSAQHPCEPHCEEEEEDTGDPVGDLLALVPLLLAAASVALRGPQPPRRRG